MPSFSTGFSEVGGCRRFQPAFTVSDYNSAGWLTYSQLPNGYELFYDYDAMGRLTWKNMYGNGFAPGPIRRRRPTYGCRYCNFWFEYDAAGNMTHTSRDGMWIDMTYDSEGRLASVTEETYGIVSPSNSETTYTFDPQTGRLSTATTGSDRTETRQTSYSYDSNGLVSSITNPFTAAVSTYGYDQAGRVASRTDPGGLSWERTYEPATGLVSSQVITGPSGQLARFALGYDQAANVTSRTEIVAAPEGGSTPGSGTWSYAYDGPGRMISATDPDGQITTYGYDNAGNRTSVKVGSAPAVTTSYDGAGLAVSSSDGTVFANDEVGSLTGVDAPGTDQDRCYFYDGFGMLYSTASGISSGCSRTTADIVYYSDSLGRVTQREDSRSVEEDGSGITGELSFYEGIGSDLVAVVGSTDYVPGEVSEYAYNLSGPFAYSSDTGQGYFLNDLHGDVVGQTNSSAAIAGSKLYSPWGEPMAQLGENSRLGYQGQPTDADTGLVKTQTRWLSPSMGRFQTRDVLFGDTQSPGSLNQFGYVEGNPVTMSDPTGKQWAEAESCLLTVRWDKCDKADVLGHIAKFLALEMFPGKGNWDISDAFRHCLWSALMTIYIGRADAARIAGIHEFGQTGPQTLMDSLNNLVGRNVGTLALTTTHPYDSCVAGCYFRATHGGLWRVNRAGTKVVRTRG